MAVYRVTYHCLKRVCLFNTGFEYICIPMKSLLLSLFFLCCTLLVSLTNAQDNLPSFKIKLLQDGKVLISWHNPNLNCVKLLVQRSTDEKNYTTIVAAKKPNLFENSFTDTKTPVQTNTFYRILYTLKNGATYITKPLNTLKKENLVKTETQNASADWKASPFVFTNNSGYIQIHVNNASENKYSIKFLDDKGNTVLKINKINEDQLILDKTNFIHAGWFQFELYKNELLLEKNSVYLKEN